MQLVWLKLFEVISHNMDYVMSNSLIFNDNGTITVHTDMASPKLTVYLYQYTLYK